MLTTTRAPHLCRSFALTVAAALALAGALGGCGSSPDDTSHDALMSDLSPELLTLNQRPVDTGDAMSVTFNSNWRAMWGDITRGLLIDRPSRLAPLPIAH